jgi:UDP-N-acetylmuramoylalanine--D-glutamate ligase
MAGYEAAKRGIFARQQAGDTAVVGIDDAGSAAVARALEAAGAHVVRISGGQRADIWAEGLILRDASGPIVDLAAAQALPGAHNAQNAAAAAALALSLGVARQHVAAGIETFPGLAHRQEHVGQIGGIAFVNDSKATNADAAARALGCYDRLIWIAGGIAKAGGIDPLSPFFPRIAKALLIGRDAADFAATLAARGVPHSVVETLDRAVPEALHAARALGAQTVLLSPACASFDQFSGFEERGARFAALVHALAAEDERA